ncbi:hypothetical protein TNCV_2730571 [Trichonephila clavipes]|nr:hypothetical protein TNCV_2730571 [Trichonephila clavipes]
MSLYTNSSEKSCRTTGSIASKRSIRIPNSRKKKRSTERKDDATVLYQNPMMLLLKIKSQIKSNPFRVFLAFVSARSTFK